MRSRWIALLLSPIGLLLISAFRLLVISHYNATTAVTVAESGGYVNTLLGSVIPLLPVFIPYIALILLLAQQYTLTIIAFAFTVVISPTPLKLPVTERLAKLDERALLRVDANQQVLTITILVFILLIAAWYYQSFAEGLSTIVVLFVALTLAATPFLIPSVLQRALPSASRDERKLFAWVPRDSVLIIAIVVSVIVALMVLLGLASFLRSHQLADLAATGMVATSRIMAFIAAAAAAISFFPYLYDIYPLPRHANYYVTAVRQPWLQAEEIAVTSGRVYVGYVLSTADSWFIVLQARPRTIVYIRDAHVLSRRVCQPKLHHQPTRHRPLIPLFYSRPPHIPTCRTS